MFKVWVHGSSLEALHLNYIDFFLVLYNSLMSKAPSSCQEKAVRSLTLKEECGMHLHCHQGGTASGAIAQEKRLTPNTSIPSERQRSSLRASCDVPQAGSAQTCFMAGR